MSIKHASHKAYREVKGPGGRAVSDNLGSFTGGPRKKIRITSTLLDTGGNDSC